MIKKKIFKYLPAVLYSLVFIVFGILALFFNKLTLISLASVFAILSIAGGIFLVLGILIKDSYKRNMPLLLFEGIVGLLFGVFILIFPHKAVKIFFILIGFWSIFLGFILLIVPSFFRDFRLKKINRFTLIAGIVSLIFGLIILFNPFSSGRFVTIILGIYSLFYGIYSLSQSIISIKE